MAKVTSKLQVTTPRRLANECGIKPGDEVEVSASAGGLRIVPAPLDPKIQQRLKSFDQATKRQERRQRGKKIEPTADRGWTREELYGDRGLPR
jgi:AbrB family looped-hinge helix DNA binding protein